MHVCTVQGNVWQGDRGCTKNDFKDCTEEQVRDLNGYMADFLTDLRASPKFKRAGEGGFIESCLEHCGAQNPHGFDDYTIRGVTMQAALSHWWNSDVSDPAAKHWYLPCQLSEKAPHQCNPTCEGKSLPAAVGEDW